MYLIAWNYRSYSRCYSRFMAGLRDRWCNPEDGRKGKQPGASFDKNRLTLHDTCVTPGHGNAVVMKGLSLPEGDKERFRNKRTSWGSFLTPTYLFT